MYRFLRPWLGSGLLTGTGTVIEQYSAAVSNVIDLRYTATVINMFEQHSVAVSNVIDLRYTAVSKLMEQISASVSKLLKHNMLMLLR
jgi:hypothetical protein